MVTQPKRFGFIDSLRAIAILGVIAVHTSQWVQPGSELLQKITAEGARGVQLFFVASALTIFMSLKSRASLEHAPIRNYFLRRFFRIAPLFYLAIAYWLLVDGFLPRYWAPNGINGLTVLLTATFLHGFHPETITSLVPGGWSIAVEMVFYLIAPLLIYLIRNLGHALVFLVISLLINVILSGFMYRHYSGIYVADQQYLANSYVLLWFPAQQTVFIFGQVVFFCLRKPIFFNCSYLFGYALLFLVVILWTLLLVVDLSSKFLPSHVLYSASFALLALALAVNPTRILVNPAMCKVGEISFSLYITHFVVLRFIGKLFSHDEFPIHGNVGFFAAWLLVIVISSALSLFTYRYVEQPGINFGRYLIDRLERNGATRAK